MEKSATSPDMEISDALPTAYQVLRGPRLIEKPVKTAIELRQVEKIYYTAAGDFHALKKINIQMCQAEFVSLVGKSGSGKSTLLNMITGIDYPTAGEVIIGDIDIYHMNESQRALWRGRNIGIVFQFFQLLPTLTLLENTMLAMDYCRVIPSAERPKRALELMDLVGLTEFAYKLPGSVSSGQQQSAAIARALANDPPIIVADEPTGNLDSHSAEVIVELFDKLASQGKTILIVTHDPSLTKRTDRTLIISDGEIIDHTIAQAFPLLKHSQMLKATKLLEYKRYEAGATIVHQGQDINYFYLIASGEVTIVLNRKDSSEVEVTRLGAGQFFGEVELMQGGASIASVRAGKSAPLELALLPREAFSQLLTGSQITEDALGKLVQTRLQENRSQDDRGQRKPRSKRRPFWRKSD